ncbi:MAG: hypothetical protein ACE14S_07180 [Candidatus Bathyarchaeia archaeon]
MKSKRFLWVALFLLVLSVVLAVVSLIPVSGVNGESRAIVDDAFRLAPLETWRHPLGSFHGDENISITVSAAEGGFANFSVVTYGGPRYSSVFTSVLKCSFPAGADYYEVALWTNATSTKDVHLEVTVARTEVAYPFSWLSDPAKALFFSGWSAIVLLLLLARSEASFSFSASAEKTKSQLLGPRRLRGLQVVCLLSLVFWLVLLAVNTYPLGTFENWYTDHARHPYSATLFTKVGFSVFDTPLSTLASGDSSGYMFVTWPEMPHLYPLGSIFLFLPFAWLLESGVAQLLVFKLEVALFLVVSHVCLYFFLRRFWRQEMSFALKALGVYLLYVVLVVYSANGQFDGVAFLFSMAAMFMFLEDRTDMFLLFAAVSAMFKYQAGIFLLPVVLVSLLKLAQQRRFGNVFRSKAIIAAASLAGVSLFTAYLSAPFLLGARPELVMSAVNAFSPNSQIPWVLQAFAVLLTLAVTLVSALYLLDRSRLVALFAVFSLLPSFTMPYFQPWYLPFFLVYALIPGKKPALGATMVWLVFMMFVLSFGGLAYNPVSIFDNVRRVLNL